LPYVVPRAEVSVLGIGVDAIGTDSLGVATVFLIVHCGLWNQILRLIARIPANSVQEGKTIPYRNNDLNAEFKGGPCLATNDGTDLSLNQVHNSVGNPTRITVE
jgi:hypothetical protein